MATAPKLFKWPKRHILTSLKVTCLNFYMELHNIISNVCTDQSLPYVAFNSFLFKIRLSQQHFLSLWWVKCSIGVFVIGSRISDNVLSRSRLFVVFIVLYRKICDNFLFKKKTWKVWWEWSHTFTQILLENYTVFLDNNGVSVFTNA